LEVEPAVVLAALPKLMESVRLFRKAAHQLQGMPMGGGGKVGKQFAIGRERRNPCQDISGL
jgi:hypothetical protein